MAAPEWIAPTTQVISALASSGALIIAVRVAARQADQVAREQIGRVVLTFQGEDDVDLPTGVVKMVTVANHSDLPIDGVEVFLVANAHARYRRLLRITYHDEIDKPRPRPVPRTITRTRIDPGNYCRYDLDSDSIDDSSGLREGPLKGISARAQVIDSAGRRWLIGPESKDRLMRARWNRRWAGFAYERERSRRPF